jgi:hypothetical protein
MLNHNLKKNIMKLVLPQLYVATAIVIIVLLGSNSLNFSFIEKIANTKIVQGERIEFAHGSIEVPTMNQANIACNNGIENPVTVPEILYLRDFERELYTFILNREYATKLGWCVDKRVRDTGPFINYTYYGIHPAVRIYYSPRMMYWLTGDPSFWEEGRKKGLAPNQEPRIGAVPAGAMIVKEMFTPPADIYQEIQSILQANSNKDCNKEELYEELIGKLIESWTIMIKTENHSKDDWFWAQPGAPKEGQSIKDAVNSQLDDYSHILYAGFGAPCLRCHASAKEESTFSDLRNIKGFLPDENLLLFRNDNSWRTEATLESYPLNQILEEKCMEDSLVKQLFELPKELLPWTDDDIMGWKEYMKEHMRPIDPVDFEVTAERLASVNPDFVASFPGLEKVRSNDFRVFPTQWADHVPVGADGPEQYITSDNCLACHGGLAGDPYDIAMFIKTGPNYGDGYNVSEYGEWRWSPMGLAGRDPIFFAQLESEMALLKENERTGGLLVGSLKDNQEQVTNTCMSCHGSMGQRQLMIDAQKDPSLDPNFKIDYVFLYELLDSLEKKPVNYQYHKYGELAREGISCTTCHHIDGPEMKEVRSWTPKNPKWLNNPTLKQKELAYFLFHNTTGNYKAGPPDELYGPFEDVATLPMENQMGIKPIFNSFIKDSKMCGTCHTINLPNIGLEKNKFPVLTDAEHNPALKPYNHTIEQATFLEWQNSIFGRPGDEFKSCQDCHMPGGFQSLDGSIDIAQLSTKIATVQDVTYPEVDNLADEEDVTVPLRPDYKRHEHVGLNVFLLEMFDQFPDILGVSKSDFMTSDTLGNALAIQNMLKQARNETLAIDVKIESVKRNKLTVSVTSTNLTGHRLPSGVAFRRAFLELLVMDGNEVIWGSGRTNSVGVIVDGNGRHLKSEFLPDSNTYQPHYQKITREDQVQIYEELNQNIDKEFTTSFIHRVYPIKDNRLLPKGWRAASHFKDQGEVIFQFMEATDPEHVGNDPDYMDQGPSFPGQDKVVYEITLPYSIEECDLSVKATMYSQAIPPYWLHQRFSIAPKGEATKRLYYLTSHLNLDGTAMENWKLPLVSKEVRLP